MQPPATPKTLLNALRLPGQPGAAAAWYQFAQLNADIILAWVRRDGVPNNDAADVAQEILLRLHNGGLLTYQSREGRPFWRWLRTVVRNACRDYFRNRAKLPRPARDAVAEATEDDALAAFDDADEAEYLLGRIRQALPLIQPEFPADVWAAFLRTYIEGQPISQVASQLGKTTNYICVSRCRVLARLREFLRFHLVE